ncbi:unnamed protein product [Closterium sp. Yama58-4]|nr:unnamed protein product [Closterium sp. Yama58-4]
MPVDDSFGRTPEATDEARRRAPNQGAPAQVRALAAEGHRAEGQVRPRPPRGEQVRDREARQQQGRRGREGDWRANARLPSGLLFGPRACTPKQQGRFGTAPGRTQTHQQMAHKWLVADPYPVARLAATLAARLAADQGA